MTVARTCPICNTSFPATAGKRFCSRECQLKGRAKPAELTTNVHVVIPDTQCRPGVPTDHLTWIDRFIAEEYADGRKGELTVIHLGDHWDMPSLSSYDKGKKASEGRRYIEDVESGNAGFRLLSQSWADADCRRVFLFGNHEERIVRATEDDAQLDGLMSLDHLDTLDWERVPFLKPIWIDGVCYAHYFANQMTGRPLAGQSMDARIKTVGHTFTMGHQQGRWFGSRDTIAGSQIGLVVGSAYLHEEEYKGPQGNNHWRGIVVCHDVEDGTYDPMFVSLNYLCKRYEGMRLRDFLAHSEAA